MCCRLSARHGASWKPYFYERLHSESSARTVRVVALDSSAHVLRLEDPDKAVVGPIQSAALCGSPDGRFIAADEGVQTITIR